MTPIRREEIDVRLSANMPKPQDLFRIFGILLLSLTSIGLVSRTAKIMLGKRGSGTKPIDLVYDSDHGKNLSHVCPFVYDPDSNPFRIRHEKSPCFEKTLIQWYVPWTKTFVWTGFLNENRKRRRKREDERKKKADEEKKKLGLGSESLDGENPVDGGGSRRSDDDSDADDEKSSRVVYTISAALLVASATFACWEVLKEKAKKPASAERTKTRGDRKFSLADFTVDRHLRRESRQAEMQQVQRQPSFDRSSKVTQTLIHQGSLDRAISKIGSEGKVRDVSNEPFIVFFVSLFPFFSISSFYQGTTVSFGTENRLNP